MDKVDDEVEKNAEIDKLHQQFEDTKLKICPGRSTSCESDSPRGVSAFLISDEALERLSKPPNEKEGEKQTTTWRVFERQERDWRMRMRGLEESYAQRLGTDPMSLDRLESNLTQWGRRADVPCDAGNPLLKCYKENPKAPLICSPEVSDYVDCLSSWRQKKFGS